MDESGDDESPSCNPEPDPQFYDFLGLSHSTDSRPEKLQIQSTDLSDFLGLTHSTDIGLSHSANTGLIHSTDAGLIHPTDIVWSHSTDSWEEKVQRQWDSTDTGLNHCTDSGHSGLTHSTDSKTEKFQIQWDSSVPDLVVSWFSRQNHPKPTPQEVVDTITSFYSLWKRRNFTYNESDRIICDYHGVHLDTFSTLGEEFQIVLKGVRSRYYSSNGSAIYFRMHVNIKEDARISFINGHFRAITNFKRTQPLSWTPNQVERDNQWKLCSLVDTSGLDESKLLRLDGLQLDYYCNIGQIKYCDAKHPDVQLFPSLAEKCTFQWKIEGDDMKMLKDDSMENVSIVNRSLCDLGWTLEMKLQSKRNGCYLYELCVEPLYPPTLQGSYIEAVSGRVWYEIGGQKIERKMDWRAQYSCNLLVSENNTLLFKDLVDESEILLEGDIYCRVYTQFPRRF